LTTEAGDFLVEAVKEAGVKSVEELAQNAKKLAGFIR